MAFRSKPVVTSQQQPETRAVIPGFSVKHRFVSQDADTASVELVRPSNWNDEHDIVGGARGDILYRGAAGWATLAAGTAGNLLQTNGPSSDPGWVTPPAGGGGTPADNSVTYAKIQDVTTTARVLGRKTAAAGDPEECSLSEVLDFIGTAARGDILYRGAAGWAKLVAGTAGHVLQTGGASGDPSWVAGGGGTPSDDSVTYAKMQNVSATARVLGRKTAGTGDPEECTLSEVLDFVGSAARGDILYRGASGWTKLGAGTAGHVLRTNGASADPSWAAAAGAASGPEIYLSDFGVTGNGSTDDTAAINAAFASVVGQAATVVWDVKYCKVTSSIIVGQINGVAGGVTSFISIFCPFGQVQSGIRWFGPTNGEAMVFGKNKYCRVTGLGILNQVAKGTTVGLVLGGEGAGSGNQTLAVEFNGCHISGFNVGCQAGGHNGAASEISFNDVQFDNCNTGFISTDFNSLDFLFSMCSLSGNGIGLDTGACSGLAVLGGSASFSSVADFAIGSNSQQTYIGGGFRSEVAKNLVQGDGGSVTIEKVLAVSPPTPFNSISGSFGSLIVRDCALQGFIAPSAVNGTYEIVGCFLERWDTTRKLPAIISVAAPGNNLRTRTYWRDNTDSVFPPRQINDLTGLTGVRLADGGTTSPFYEPVITVIPRDQSSATDIGCNYLALSHVRHLGEGTLTGATAATAPNTGKNLRVRGTFAGSATLNFVFTRTNMIVSATGGQIVTATTGTFNQSDVGKKLKITAGADTGADWYGYITEYLTPTTVNVFPSSDSTPGGRYPSGSTKNTVLGQDEPDGNYMVAGLVGNIGETFWVDNITASGFTLHSSNATSTATVTALIVR